MLSAYIFDVVLGISKRVCYRGKASSGCESVLKTILVDRSVTSVVFNPV